MRARKIDHDPGHTLGSPFLALAGQYRDILASEGVAVRISSQAGGCPVFNGLGEERKRSILETLRQDLELFGQVRDAGESLRDSPRLLWRYLRTHGLTPCSDIFDKIERDDVVSVYDTQNRQVFQNLRFLELVTLTLEQLFCEPWHAYIQRPEWINQSLYETAVSILSGQVRSTVEVPAPEHLAQEINTEGLVKLLIKVKWASPVLLDGRTYAMIVINRCTRVG